MNALRIAVSGMHRGDNPQPGGSIVADIRREWPDAVVVGLVYNAYESAIYAADGPQVCHTMPYPTAGLPVYLERLAEVRAATPFDWLIPTLDAEITMLAGATEQLAALGIQMRLPSAELLARCGKAKLPALARSCDVEVPETAVARDLTEALEHAGRIGYPVYVKGAFYDASLARDAAAVAAAGARSWPTGAAAHHPGAERGHRVQCDGDRRRRRWFVRVLRGAQADHQRQGQGQRFGGGPGPEVG